MFFTVVTYNRQKFFVTDQARQCFKSAWRFVLKNHPFQLIAFVLLPDHLHCIWKLPVSDPDFSIRWGKIKRHFSQHYLKSKQVTTNLTKSMIKRHEKGLWQRRFWDHVIRDSRDLEKHFHYIHYNPVKHGLVKSPKDWHWSTFHKYVRMGFYETDWGSDRIRYDNNDEFGE